MGHDLTCYIKGKRAPRMVIRQRQRQCDREARSEKGDDGTGKKDAANITHIRNGPMYSTHAADFAEP